MTDQQHPITPSPAAQAVLDAYWETFNAPLEGAIHRPLAAALRALADQVVPHPGRYPMSEYMEGLRNAKHDVRAKILAIATELATPPPEPPTDDELNALWNCCGNYDEDGDHYGNIFQFARAAIERWGAK
jgi:hypothetical protein